MNTLRRLALGVTCSTAVMWLAAAPALAHEPGTTAIEVQVGTDTVTAQLDIPVGKLGDALDLEIDTDLFSLSQQRELITGYVTDHLQVNHLQVNGIEGTEWAETVGQLTAINIDGVMHLRLLVAADPGGSVPDEFVVDYNGILVTDDTHEIYVTAVDQRVDAASDATLVGVIDSDTPALTVGADAAADVGATFTSMISRGFEHVLDGADHLLFLLVLLLPASLVATAGRWHPSDSGRRALQRVALVATAFTVGHSITLVASALGWITLPSRPVEILVAVSVAVAAVHVLRPFAVRGEEAIAGVFGLVHGLAFSGLLDDLGLGRSTSLASLLGFNLGIEAAQLVVISVTFPALWFLSQTPAYRAVQVVGASVALVASGAWIVDRLDVAANPFSSIENAAVDHLGLIGTLLAAVAGVTWSVKAAASRRVVGTPEGLY
jgi:hypothetical protein